MDGIDKWFKLTERGTTVGTEIRAGITTFLTMAYILLVNPQILGVAGLPLKEVVTSTALTSCIASLLCGLFANLPVGIAPGMGLNAYLVFSQVLGMKVSVESALACCFTASVLVAVLALIRALSLILALVPNTIKLATVVGMGVLLSFIGLQTAHVVVKDEETMVTLGNLASAEVLLALMGLAIIATLHYRNIKGSILIGIVVTALAYYAVKSSWPTSFVAMPSLAFWKLDFSDVLAFKPEAWSAVCAYALVMIFDIGGAMYGLGNLAGLVKDGAVPGAVATYLSASIATAFGSLTGTTPLIIAAESAVGIKEGGRTGLVGVTVSVCFAISLFFAPILQAVPPVATAPVLVLVGAMMMGECHHIDFTNMVSAVPAFLTIVIQPFTFSIANGIYAGLVFSLALFILSGDFIPYFKNLASGSADGLDEPLLPDQEAHVSSGSADLRHGSLAQTMQHAVHKIVEGQAPFERTSHALLVNTQGTPPHSSSLAGSYPGR
mmetsp:Transcript_22407/g.48964  ORF Transcript_22407/g.48964 Transcript_22407/m.48964 type:complete len:494 (-) Transcript_22407:592-2073(-)|eukprot:CAMPEP_0202895248 /NCGR_PEP_ID=MMETSP1392-20130828/4486_1 /ASSEMBLY_ACC=CAM_ASM_000868 /TAXON_ID=225041 /ORGANISM="Chlamydomonas chlamydogama, Strain SAG 11-48b" /LENGTH=493 /DNA_ID=CAMNT_0049580189 /DNA_START=89 /DNA_END=1570 /DNA_ORIENTATION=+